MAGSRPDQLLILDIEQGIVADKESRDSHMETGGEGWIDFAGITGRQHAETQIQLLCGRLGMLLVRRGIRVVRVDQ
jgi:hypothetical protein